MAGASGRISDMTPEEWTKAVQEATRSVAPPQSVPPVSVSPPQQRKEQPPIIPATYTNPNEVGWNAGPWGVAQSLADRISAIREEGARNAFEGPPAPVGVQSNGPIAASLNAGWRKGSADSQAAKIGISRGGAVDNFGHSVAFDVPKPNAYPAGAPEGGVAQNDERLARMRDELAMYGARDRADQQGRIQAMGANANWASDWRAQRDAESNARVANWRATNGADMVLAGGNPAYEGQRIGILGAVHDANARLSAADANLQKSQAGLTGPPRNYIDEMAKSQASVGAGMLARGRNAEDLAKASLAGPTAEGIQAETRVKKLTADQHQLLLDLGVKMGTAKTPADARMFERQMLALVGKTGKDWKAERMGGEVRVDPVTGMPAGKDADSVIIYNEQTGEQHIIGPGGVAAGVAQKRTPLKAEIDLITKEPTPENIKFFESHYGPGSAAQYRKAK